MQTIQTNRETKQMTEERYILDPSINHITDKLTEKQYSEHNLNEITQILNDQDDTIRFFSKVIIQLQKENKGYHQRNLKGANMKRYTQLNDYYIIDTYTGQKLNQKQTITRLNKYETELQKENGE